MAVEQILQRAFVAGGDQLVGLGDDGLVPLVFREVGLHIVVTVRVEQAQAGEVTFGPQLLGGCGEQNHPGRGAGEGVDQLVSGAGRLGTPGQMVGFVDDEQIPSGGDYLGQPVGVAQQKLRAAHDALFVEKRVVFVVGFHRGTARFIEDAEDQRKATDQFDEPLVHQRVRHEDEHAADFPGGQHAVQDQAGFDGFAEADLVGQQHARHIATAHLGGDVNLMRQQIDAPAEQTAHRFRFHTGTLTQGFVAHIKHPPRVGMPGGQARLGPVE